MNNDEELLELLSNLVGQINRNTEAVAILADAVNILMDKRLDKS